MTRPFLPELVDFQKNWRGEGVLQPPAPPARTPMDVSLIKMLNARAAKLSDKGYTSVYLFIGGVLHFHAY